MSPAPRVHVSLPASAYIGAIASFLFVFIGGGFALSLAVPMLLKQMRTAGGSPWHPWMLILMSWGTAYVLGGLSAWHSLRLAKQKALDEAVREVAPTVTHGPWWKRSWAIQLGGTLLGALIGAVVGMIIGRETFDIVVNGILGLATGYCISALMVVIRRSRHNPEAILQQEIARPACPACGEPLAADASECPVCGRSTDQPPTSPSDS